MGLLSRLPVLSGLKSIFTSKADAASLTNVTEWHGDAVLRKLAQDYRDNKTKWVLASDMSEFFTKLDAYNEGRSDKDKIRIRVSDSAHDYLCCAIRMNSHAPVDMKDEITLEKLHQHMGPQTIGEDHLRVQRGGNILRAYYHADPMNMNLNIEGPDGKWHGIEFGMGDAFGAVFPALPSANGPSVH
jgi:hypothetical protein